MRTVDLRRSSPHHGHAKTALLIAGAMLFSLASGEVAVRWLGEVDLNGQFQLHGYNVRPLTLPTESLRQALAAYHGGDDLTIVYDSTLGWAPVRNGRSADGLYGYNSAGVRADREYSSDPDSTVVRVLVFGDSFVHGDEVTVEETFIEQTPALCERLGSTRRVEVLNLGVPGYGLEQAILRIERIAPQFHPDIVILGFQPENIMRATNIIRLFYNPHSGLPYSKPRFVLRDGKLSLLNSPCLPPDEVAAAVRNPDAWELRELESYYRPEDYVPVWWRKSRFLSFAADVVDRKLHPPFRAFDVDSEGGRISLALFERAEDACAAMSADFLLLHLPIHYYLDRWQRKGFFEYQAMLDSLDARYPLISTEAALRDASEGDASSLFGKHHYNARAHSVIAEALAKAIVAHEQRHAGPNQVPDPSKE